MSVSMRQARALGHGLIYLIVSVGAVAMLFPLLWTVSTSLKTVDKIVVTRIALMPDPVAWNNYVKLFDRMDVTKQFTNTMTIVLAAEIGALAICSLVAYGFACIDFPGRDIMFILLLSTMMLPGVVTLVPYFIMWDRLGLVNTFYPLIIPRFLAHNPFYIFLMRQFFRGLPTDLFDAARIDGCSDLGIWRRIVLPMSMPVLATVAIFTFQWAWNDFMSPLIYLSGDKHKWTLALGLNALKGFEGETTVHFQMALSVLMIIPVLVVFALGQKYIIQGVTFSGIKG
ncbi:MAG: carbohydrate ABC transporter permease [Chloroflexi bacterium]|nr:carbohydrate ABC transporter permease [Chloroflexota bacterium]